MWQTNAIQLVWFTHEAEGVDPSRFFREVLGQEPATIYRNTAPTPQNPFLSKAEGPPDNVRHAVSVQQGRIDAFIGDGAQSGAMGSTIDTNAARGIIDTILDRISDPKVLLPGAFRCSIVLTESTRADSTKDSLRIANGYLGNIVPFEDGTDLIFQINIRDLPTDRDNVTYNNVVKITTEVVQHIDFMVSAPTYIPKVTEFNRVGRSFDFNTVPSSTAWQKMDQVRIFKNIAEKLYKAQDIATISELRGGR